MLRCSGDSVQYKKSRNYSKGLYHWKFSVFSINLRFSKLNDYSAGVPHLPHGKFLSWFGGPPTVSYPRISMITDPESIRFNNKQIFGIFWHLGWIRKCRDIPLSWIFLCRDWCTRPLVHRLLKWAIIESQKLLWEAKLMRLLGTAKEQVRTWGRGEPTWVLELLGIRGSSCRKPCPGNPGSCWTALTPNPLQHHERKLPCLFSFFIHTSTGISSEASLQPRLSFFTPLPLFLAPSLSSLLLAWSGPPPALHGCRHHSWNLCLTQILSLNLVILVYSSCSSWDFCCWPFLTTLALSHLGCKTEFHTPGDESQDPGLPFDSGDG